MKKINFDFHFSCAIVACLSMLIALPIAINGQGNLDQLNIAAAIFVMPTGTLIVIGLIVDLIKIH